MLPMKVYTTKYMPEANHSAAVYQVAFLLLGRGAHTLVAQRLQATPVPTKVPWLRSCRKATQIIRPAVKGHLAHLGHKLRAIKLDWEPPRSHHGSERLT